MRFFSVFGPREESKKQYVNMVSQFLWQMCWGEAPEIYGDGSQTRDFIHVHDVVRALRLAMGSGYQGVINVVMRKFIMQFASLIFTDRTVWSLR